MSLQRKDNWVTVAHMSGLLLGGQDGPRHIQSLPLAADPQNCSKQFKQLVLVLGKLCRLFRVPGYFVRALIHLCHKVPRYYLFLEAFSLSQMCVLHSAMRQGCSWRTSTWAGTHFIAQTFRGCLTLRTGFRALSSSEAREPWLQEEASTGHTWT